MSHQDLAPLPGGYRVEPLEGQNRLGPDDVVAFWAAQGALPPTEAARRVHEVLYVGVGPGDELVGVSTAFLQRSRQLRLSFWYLRMFVAAEHRKGNLAFRLLLACRDHLRERHESGADRRAAGAMVEVQHQGLRGHLTAATWRSDFTYIGQNSGGDHMRVHYFPGVSVPAPPVPPALVPRV